LGTSARRETVALAVMKSKPAIAASASNFEESPAALFWGLDSRQTALLAAIVLATIAIYLPSLRNGWVFDDWEEFVDNKLIHSWSFVWNSFRYDSWWFKDPTNLPQSVYYRPLENTWFAANALLFGNHPAAWHLAKIILHAVAVVLCFRVAQLLTGDVAIGLLTAALFGLMPAHVEGVVWASSIPEPLTAVFELGALVCLIGRKPGQSRGMLSALALYACALLSHETAIFFPLIVAAYVFLIERGTDEQLAESSPLNRGLAAVRVSAPFAALAVAYMCVRLAVLGSKYAFTLPHPLSIDEVRGWRLALPHPGALSYLLTLPSVLLTYLGVLAVPGVAGPAHDVDWTTRASPIAFVSAGALAIVATVALVLIWRSSDRRLYLFCAASSLLALAPAMNLSSIWALVQDRYLYMPSFGWSLALAIAALRLAAASPRARTLVATAMALLLASYAVTSIRIEHYWRDDVTFFGQCLAVDPTHLGYRLKLAAAMNKAHDFEGAAQTIQRGTILDPDDAHLHLKLAQQYQMMGRELDFEREFQKFNELSIAMMQRHRAAENSDASQPPAGAP
jgi:hypothetical protein